MAVTAKQDVTSWAIKAGRQLRGMSRDELAEALQRRTGRPWSYGKVNHLENSGKAVTPELLRHLAAILDLEPDFLLYGPIGLNGERAVTVR